MVPPTSRANCAIAPEIPDLLGRLDLQLQRLLGEEGPFQRPLILSYTLPLPELVGHRLPSPSAGSVYWVGPGRHHQRFAMGSVYGLYAEGPHRFRRLDAGFRSLRRRWQHREPETAGFLPQAFLGFAFEAQGGRGVPTARLQIPELFLERIGALWGLTLSARVTRASDLDGVRLRWVERASALLARLAEPAPPALTPPRIITRIATEPSDEAWVQRVETALSAIRAGRLRKVVLTRRTRVRATAVLEAGHVLGWLEEQYPDCAQFAYADGAGTLVGASPERLLRRIGSRVVSDAVASTTVRDPNGHIDEHLGEALMGCRKARYEHALVVDGIVDALRPLCKALDVPSEPRLMKLPTVQHLWTPVTGELKPGVSSLQLVERLHPTPAVGGVPRREALAWMDAQGERRGWYTGALGWLAPDGSGELSVVLRCAMLKGRVADLYAGAGIVADSDPGRELAETEWKFCTMLDALAMA